jgi:CheY-like chemotaxis protein
MADARTLTYEEGPRPALVCVDADDRQAAATAALEELGYTVEVAPDAEEAIERMRKTAYHVVIVDETFAGATPLDNLVLKSLAGMNMSARRHIFVLVIAPDVVTLDHATAFARSVNAVVSYNDLGQLMPILRRAVADNDAFYRVFREVLLAAGKR